MKATLDPVKDDELVVKAEVTVANRPATRIEIIFMAGDGCCRVGLIGQQSLMTNCDV
jgi:thioredoxin reductase